MHTKSCVDSNSSQISTDIFMTKHVLGIPFVDYFGRFIIIYVVADVLVVNWIFVLTL